MSTSIETMESMAASLAELTSDLANLRDLERSGWLVLEGRIRALEEQQPGIRLRWIRVTGGFGAQFVPSMREAVKAAEDAERQAKIDEVSRDLAKHPSARRMTMSTVDEAIAGEVERDAQAGRLARLRRMTETLEQVTAERDQALEETAGLRAYLAELEECIRELRARNNDFEPAPMGDVSASLLEERDRARASAIEWANTPIHRLLTAYNERRVARDVAAQAGDLQNLEIREGERDWWWVTWSTWTETHGWMPTRHSADTLDKACTAAAEQIDAT